jgi:hypothetical protein
VSFSDIATPPIGSQLLAWIRIKLKSNHGVTSCNCAGVLVHHPPATVTSEEKTQRGLCAGHAAARSSPSVQRCQCAERAGNRKLQMTEFERYDWYGEQSEDINDSYRAALQALTELMAQYGVPEALRVRIAQLMIELADQVNRH